VYNVVSYVIIVRIVHIVYNVIKISIVLLDRMVYVDVWMDIFSIINMVMRRVINI